MTPTTKENETTRASLDLLYHISRELASALDLRTVLERVLFLSMRNTRAIRGSIIVMDDNGRPLESAVIAGDQVMDRNTQRLRATLDRGLAGWVVRNQQPALVFNTSQDERWMLQHYEMADEGVDSKSAVSSPIMVRERLIGVITLVHPQPNYFTEEHLELVKAIADQAGIAILNARLYAESQRQAKIMTALAETAAVITGSLNLEEVFLRILDQIMQALSVQAVCLALIDPNQETLSVRAAKGWASPLTNNATIKLGQGITGWVAREGRPLIVYDATKDPRFDQETQIRTGLDTRAIACAPLKHRGKVIGVIEVINPKDGTFVSGAHILLSGIGSLAGTAVRHAQLFERMQAAHQSYRELFEDSIDPILITDFSGKVMQANRKALLATGLAKEAVVGLPIEKIHRLNREQVGADFSKITPDNPVIYESALQAQSDVAMPILVHVRLVMIEGNILLQWTLRDITERKKLDTMRDDLISMIYHDLRSPLANVVSSLDILNSMLPAEDPTASSLVSIALRSTERIQRLTNSLLDISRLEAGQTVGDRQNFDPLQIVKEAYDIVNPVAENKNQHINTVLEDHLPMVFVDGEMIRRVVVNLLENASKFSPSGSMIQLGAMQDGEWVRIWVQDDGPGIPEAEHDRVFNKFTRLGALEPSTKGLGLGLAYCRLAVEAHQGRIWLESAPGNGAYFAFTLPISSKEAVPETE
jgi:two-component system, NtrC family, sensor histidine kinase KinB